MQKRGRAPIELPCFGGKKRVYRVLQFEGSGEREKKKKGLYHRVYYPLLTKKKGKPCTKENNPQKRRDYQGGG